MAEPLKTTLLDFFREYERSHPFITELEVRCEIDWLNPQKGTDSDGFFQKALKCLSSHITPVLARLFNLSLQAAYVHENWRRVIVTLVATPPRTTGSRQFRPINLTFSVCKIMETIIKEKHLSTCPNFPN